MHKWLLILLLSFSANAQEAKQEVEQPADDALVCTATKLPTGCHMCCETSGIRACRLLPKKACPKVKGEEE